MLTQPLEEITASHELLDSLYAVTEKQVTDLRDEGWTLLPGLLSKDVVEELRVALSDVESIDTSGGEYAGLTVKFSSGWLRPYVRRVATSRRMVGTITQLSGQPSTVFAQDVTFIKTPGCPPAAFHQDHPHFPFDRKGCITIWVALVDMTEEMGPLKYLEKSHLGGPLGFASNPEMLKSFPELAEYKVVAGKDLKAGDAQAHWDMTVHGTGANNGSRAREAWAARYVRPDTIYNGVSHSHFDQFGLKQGDRFGEVEAFPHFGPDGPIQK